MEGAMRNLLNIVMHIRRPSRGEPCGLAEEWGALQHVATLVARGASPPAIFNAAASALGSLIKADYSMINRCEIDQMMSVVTLWHAPGAPEISLPLGGRWPLFKDTASSAALQTRKPARRAAETIHSDIGGWNRTADVGHAVACPVIVDDRLWGTMAGLYLGSKPPPINTEERMQKFIELLSCTIAQAEARAELITARARLVTNADATRRRIERDLHDGAQQHLITLALQLRETEASMPSECQGLKQQLSDTVQGLSNVLVELQEISRGLRPPVLSRRGLKAALEVLVSRSPIPVELRIDAGWRLPEELEVTLYYVVSEALTNVMKHAHASIVHVNLNQEDQKICLMICDNGIGGADPTRGSGLIGFKDRVESVGGTVQVTSPIGEGTSLLVNIPSPRTLSDDEAAT